MEQSLCTHRLEFLHEDCYLHQRKQPTYYREHVIGYRRCLQDYGTMQVGAFHQFALQQWATNEPWKDRSVNRIQLQSAIHTLTQSNLHPLKD